LKDLRQTAVKKGKTIRAILQAVGVMALLAGAAYLVALVALSFAFRSPPFRAYPPDAADIALLAQDVHLRIGGVRVVLPLAALEREARFHTFHTDRGEDWRQQKSAARAAFAETANNPAMPLDLSWVDLGLRA
jgi:hypothetical protein